MSRLIKAVLSFGPGIFAIGYTIGTGSVTSMIVAGSTFGMGLLWVLVLSCLFSGALIYAYGNFALVTGETALHAFRKYLPFGSAIGILIIVGVTFGQWNSLIGILGISSNIIYELFVLYFPAIAPHKYWVVIGIAVVVISIMYGILLKGQYTIFEKLLVFFVSIMGISFFISLFMVHPLPAEVARGLIPTIPDVPGGKMMVAAFVGTTMAAATFLSRPLFIKGKGWTMENQDQQRRDAFVAATLVFIVSASIMAVATGALYQKQEPVTEVIGMVGALEPIAGKLALTLFFFGTLSAGLSSVFPILLISPLLIADFRSGTLDTSSTQFRIITAVASVLALAVPVLGSNPIKGQLLSQVFNVFVLPLVVAGIIVVINNKKLMREHAAGYLLNAILGLALLFSIIISYNGVIAIFNQFA